MENIQLQIISHWISVVFAFAGTFLFIACIAFKKENFLKYGSFVAWPTLAASTAALILRWVQTGHYPNQGAYEVFSSYSWGLILFFVIIQTWKKGLRVAGALVMPIFLLMVGVAVMNSTEITEMPANYSTFWLGVHMFFAKISYGSVIISAGLALAYLLKSWQANKEEKNPLLEKLPDLDNIDYMTFRFGYFAFLMLGIMIASGAIWAFKAWGRYWGWDPIETWALISWLVYGLYIHLRRTWGWTGKRGAWLGIFAVALLVFAFFVAPFISETVHGHIPGTEQ